MEGVLDGGVDELGILLYNGVGIEDGTLGISFITVKVTSKYRQECHQNPRFTVE